MMISIIRVSIFIMIICMSPFSIMIAVTMVIFSYIRHGMFTETEMTQALDGEKWRRVM